MGRIMMHAQLHAVVSWLLFVMMSKSTVGAYSAARPAAIDQTKGGADIVRDVVKTALDDGRSGLEASGPCSQNFCKNGGTCHEGKVPGTFTCACTDNYCGSDCSEGSNTAKIETIGVGHGYTRFYKSFDSLNAVYRGDCSKLDLLVKPKPGSELAQFEVGVLKAASAPQLDDLRVMTPDNQMYSIENGSLRIVNSGYPLYRPTFTAEIPGLSARGWCDTDKCSDRMGIEMITSFNVSVNVTNFKPLKDLVNLKNVTISIPEAGLWTGNVVGMGGNNDGDASNDLLKPDGTAARDVNEWGDFWALSSILYLPAIETAPCCFGKAADNNNCAGQNQAASYMCNDIFTAPCAEQMEQTELGKYYWGCLNDIESYCDEHNCNLNNDLKCAAAKLFGERCNNILGGYQWDWRSKYGCDDRDKTCLDNSHWNNTAVPQSCRNTCLQPQHDHHCKSSETTERCECDINSFGRWVFEQGRCYNVLECESNGPDV